MKSSHTVLITGATGFAGGFLLEQYAERGWVTHGTGHGTPMARPLIPNAVSIHPVDLLDRDATFELIATTRPDVIHHLAAQSSVGDSWNDPMGTIQQNIEMQFNLLEAVRVLHPEARILIVGSADEYGDVAPEANPIEETQPLLPVSPYGISKVAQDLLGYQYFKVFGLQVLRVRPFLQLGPRREARFVTGSFACQIAEIEAGKRPPLLSVGTIDLQRDFMDVRDATRAYARVAEHGEVGAVYNIATGAASTLRDMLQTMLSLSAVEVEIRSDTMLKRGSEPPILVGDASRLRSELGWSPQISLEQSIHETLDYWRGTVRNASVERQDWTPESTTQESTRRNT